MDATGVFKTALRRIWHHKRSILPVLLYLLLIAVFGVTAAYQFGLSDTVQVIGDLEGMSEVRSESDTLDIDGSFLLSSDFLSTVLVYFSVWFVFSLYLNCVLFLTVAQLSGNELDLQAAFTNALSFTPRFLGYKVVWLGIFSAAAGLGAAVTVLFWQLHLITGILTGVISFLGVLAVLLYCFVTFIFPLPRIFIEQDTVLTSFRESYRVTHDRFFEAGVVAALLLGVAVLTSATLGSPTVNLIGSTVMFASAPVRAILSLLFFLVLLSVYAFFITVADLYRFLAYQSFKDD